MRGADTAQFLALLRPAQRFVLATHVSPDGDGLGSQLALAALIRARGGQVTIVNADPVPYRLQFLEGVEEVELYSPDRHDPLLEQCDTIVMLDNGDPARLGAMQAAVARSRATKACIDHHRDPSDFWDLLILRLEACSTGEVVAELMQQAGFAPPRAAAEALYTALVSDTGRFRFANTDAAAFDFAAWLARAGVDPAEMHIKLEQESSLPFLRLLGHSLATMQVAVDGALVLIRISAALVQGEQVDGEDLARVINEGLSLKGCHVAALFRELGPLETKVSLRSTGERDVQALAKAHGGGGHKNAAGVVIRADVESAIARLLPDLESLARH